MKKTLLAICCSASLFTASSAFAEEANNASSASGIKVGVGHDMGFGVTAQFFDSLNAFVGNRGISADYLFIKENININNPKLKLQWYVGAGGYYDWYGDHRRDYRDDSSVGARIPVGIEFKFHRNWDAYAFLAPKLDYDLNTEDGCYHSNGREYCHNSDNDNELSFGIDFGIGIRYNF